jgi:Domain of Unknown Function (DUF1080)./TIR domain.
LAPEKQRHTFISYSRINKEFAVKLAKELKSAGFPVWLDQLDIPAGARWDDEIEKALRECGIFMTILTPASIASENAKDEIGYAIDHGKRIFPVLLQECEIPLRLRRFQYVDFTSMNYDQGVGAAKELLAKLIKEESIPVSARIPAAKERPTQPAIVRSKRPQDNFEKVVPSESARGSIKQSSTMPMAIYAGIAIFVILALMVGASFLSGIFPFTKQSPTAAPTQEIKPTTLPSPTIIADTATPAPQGFYTEEFDRNLDTWEFFKKSGKEKSEFDYTSKNGKLIVHISPKGDAPEGYLINNAFKYTDVQLEVTVTNTGNNANGISLICRYSDNGWYEFIISNDQTYAIYVIGRDGEVLQGGKAGTKKILSGKVKNVYTATCKGNELSLAVNGIPIETVKIKYDFPEGNIGIGFSSPTDLPVDLEFESLKISQP